MAWLANHMQLFCPLLPDVSSVARSVHQLDSTARVKAAGAATTHSQPALLSTYGVQRDSLRLPYRSESVKYLCANRGCYYFRCISNLKSLRELRIVSIVY